MRILLLSNPRSGRGTGAAVAASLGSRLRNAGHEVTTADAGPQLSCDELTRRLRENDLLVSAGGDGTLNHALPALIASNLPVYHFPLGTENLFTREFGMNRSPETLLLAIERGNVRLCDAATCNGRLLSLMVGIGFDACTVERVAAGRNGGVTRSAYIRHGALELLRPRIPTITVRADGRTVIDRAKGMLIIANSRQYAARLNPARTADMSDGLLDLLFYPHSTTLGLARWLFATAIGTHTSARTLITTRAPHFEVQLESPSPHQIDGEAAGAADRLDIHILPRALRVLVP